MICPVIFDIIDSNFMINVPFGKLQNIDSVWFSKFWFHQRDTKINLANTWYTVYDMLGKMPLKCYIVRINVSYEDLRILPEKNSLQMDQSLRSRKPLFKKFERVVRATAHKEIFLQPHFKVCCKYLLSNVDKLFSTEKFFSCLFEIWKPLPRLMNQNAMEGTR